MTNTKRLIWNTDPYDPDNNRAETNKSALDCEAAGDQGMTLQAPAEEHDINVIMKRFGVKDGSQLPYWPDPNAIYGDFSTMPDSPVEAAEILRQGELEFKLLPAEVRNRFESGAQLYHWLADPNHHEEAQQLGLLSKKAPEKALLVRQETPEQAQPVSSSTSSVKEKLVPDMPDVPNAGTGVTQKQPSTTGGKTNAAP